MPSQRTDLNHWRRLSRTSGVDALLRREDRKGTLRVVPGNTTTETDGGGGVVYTSRSADFLFCLADALTAIEGESLEIQEGDRLEVLGSEYEILPLDGERQFDPSGNYGIMGRMHTKYIGPVKTKQRFVRDKNDKYARDENGKYAGDTHADAS